MEQLYHKTKGLLHGIHESISRLEKAIGEEETRSLANDIKSHFDEVLKNIDRLDTYVSKEPAARRAEAKFKVDQIKYDFKHLQSGFRTVQHRKDQILLEEKQREELLRSINPSSRAGVDTSIIFNEEQHELRHLNRLNDANSRLDELIDHGSNMVSNLRNQNETIKAIRTKMLNIANILGLSNTVTRLIERRSATDRKIAYALMAATCLIIFFVIRYLL